MAYTEFPYQCQFDGDGSLFCEPKITMILEYEGKCGYYTALVDSGCYRTHVNASIAEWLGVNIGALHDTTTIGIGGDKSGKLGRMMMQVNGLGEKFEVPVVFLEELGVDILLGQNDFFERFNVRFEKWKNVFYLEPAGEGEEGQ